MGETARTASRAPPLQPDGDRMFVPDDRTTKRWRGRV